MSETCEWSQEDEGSPYFETDCGLTFQFNDDGPKENDFKFCPYCGNTLTEKKWAIEEEV